MSFLVGKRAPRSRISFPNLKIETLVAPVLTSLHRNSLHQADRATLYEQVLLDILPYQDSVRREVIRTALAKVESLRLVFQNLVVYSLGLLSTHFLFHFDRPKPDCAQGRSNAERSSMMGSGDGDEDSALSDISVESDNEDPQDIPLISSSLVDLTQVGFPHFGEAGGFLGKASVVRMIEEVGTKLTSHIRPESQETVMTLLYPVGLPGLGPDVDHLTYAKELRRIVLDEAIYYTTGTDEEHSDLNNFGADIDPLATPPLEQADAFLDEFFATLHPLFPIVLEPVFRAQHAEFRSTGFPPSPGVPLQAIINLIYALGALHAELTTSPSWDGEKDSHKIYFIRARLLSFEPLSTLELPELHDTQLLGLFGMYFLASNQLSRGWLMVGRAVRYAQNRGAYLTNDGLGDVHNAKVELEVRTWHSICSLERLACFLTGKPAACNEGSAATRPPQSLSRHNALESFNVSSAAEALSPTSSDDLEAFCASLDLDEILGHTLAKLYAPNVVLKSWASIQSLTHKLNNRVGNWRSNLAQRLLIHDGPEGEFKADIIQRVYLALRYFSVIITINRPNLYDHNEQKKSTRSQTIDLQVTDSDNARRCVSAARDMIGMFVTEPNTAELYRMSPWWCILHYLVQAATILVTEISFNAIHFPEQMTQLKADALKAISCLQMMAEKSAAAQKAANTISRLYNLALLMINSATVPAQPSSHRISADDLTNVSRDQIPVAESVPQSLAELSFENQWSPMFHAPQSNEIQPARLVTPHPIYSSTMTWDPPLAVTSEQADQSVSRSAEVSESPSESNQSRRELPRRGRKERRKG